MKKEKVTILQREWEQVRNAIQHMYDVYAEMKDDEELFAHLDYSDGGSPASIWAFSEIEDIDNVISELGSLKEVLEQERKNEFE